MAPKEEVEMLPQLQGGHTSQVFLMQMEAMQGHFHVNVSEVALGGLRRGKQKRAAGDSMVLEALGILGLAADMCPGDELTESKTHTRAHAHAGTSETGKTGDIWE